MAAVTVDWETSASWEEHIHGRLIAGDERALSELYAQYGSFVYGLASRVTSNRTAAQDVTQEVFARVWEQPERFDPRRGSLRAWLGTLTHHRSVDFVRREEAARRRAQREGDIGATIDIEEMATSLAVAERVRLAVDALPAEQRDAIRLAYFGGRTYRQVAEELGIPEGTAKSRLRIALKRVAEALEREGLERWV